MKKTLLIIVGVFLVCNICRAQCEPDAIAQSFLPQSSYFNGLQNMDYQIDTLYWDCWNKNTSPGGWPYQYIVHNRLKFLYDSENRISQIHACFYDSDPSKANTEQWNDKYKYHYEYNADGKIISYKKEEKNVNNWSNTDIYNYVYGENGLIDTIQWVHFGGGSYLFHYQYIYSYDEANNCIYSKLVSFNSNSGLWDNVFLHQFTYDNGYMTTDLKQIWDNDSWNYSDSISYSYENGQITNQTHLTWSYYGNWCNYENYIYEYVPLEYTYIYITQQTWDNGWVNKSYTVKQFNESESPIEYGFYAWQNGTWVKKGVCEYTIDGNGNCTYAVCKELVNGELADSRDNYSMELLFNNGISKLSITGQRFHVSYLQTTGMNENHGFEKANVFPNPGTNQFTIQTDTPFTKVIVYDLTGCQIYNQTLSETTIRINTENWPSGVYFWKAYDSNSAQSGKWIKY